MEYMSVKEAALKWHISDRRIRVLCSEEKISGIRKEGKNYRIPVDALKPVDGRTLRGKDIPQEYKEVFARIDAKKAELQKRRPLTQGELERLREEFLIEFTYNSNAIEGNTLTLQETASVLEGITIDKKPLKDHLEVVGHKEAFLYIVELVSKQVQISEKVIKEIHSLILVDRPHDRGAYRQIPARIKGSVYIPPQPFLVPIQMEELMKDDSLRVNKMHLIERLARFHMEFERIHPFIDGNGRIGRLLMNLELMQQGFPPTNVKFADRKRYYECFADYQEHNNASKMIIMLADYMEEELDRYLEILG
ncbi:Fic family protein [Lachnoclostridium phytofermentans]|uniref:Filamentation induced by cAMP protein Fic n=1 Tax=Lachnoclostridium phytofermentans (strain ATCC 700394 / DSM 18823 / ISDg) TaxID=357809 RepID=A9KS29_LACP7|nr:Fic family protein [Lachnoclostridium phytofermentans]ABX40660.1 filamentation induced by cAMP protein Fic [Lachnoclostridium phytofermentans ISDg]